MSQLMPLHNRIPEISACTMNGRLRSDGPSVSDPVEVKRLLAELTPDKTMPQSVRSKKWRSPHGVERS